jgi:lauroyl/myristoyl acyltransferase
VRAGPGLLPGPAAYVLNRALAPLVPLDVAYRVALPIGDLFHAALAGKRETVRRNYAAITGRSPDDLRVQDMAHDCFRHFSRYAAELLHVQGWETETVLDRVDVHGEEHFAAAASQGRGVIFVSAHMGSTEVAATLAVLKGFKITAVSEEIRPRALMDWAIASRADMGISLLPVERSAFRLLRALRRREMVAMVVDAGPGLPDSIPVRFFGRDTPFPAGPARLSRLSGAPIVFGLAVRRTGGRFAAYVCPPLLPDRRAHGDTDARRLTQEIAATFEGFVRRYPTQWYAFRDMWPQG